MNLMLALALIAPLDTATFAGGCFWSMERAFEKLDGVVSATVGYAGGRVPNPTYREVSTGRTGHVESVLVVYDPRKLSYERLLDAFWHNIDPTQADGQFCDHGPQYGTAVFYHDATQRGVAEESKQRLAQRFDQPIVTRIERAGKFYAAEEYHQDFHRKNPARYEAYRLGCGRDRRLQELWGKGWMPMTFRKPSDADLRRTLKPIQYQVTQHEGTERPFENEYWDDHRAGIYVDVISGEPLFSSLDKFDSRTGWPSFTKPLEVGNIRTKADRSLFAVRTEVRSAHADSHLGHVFDDGPAPTGLRYCINSAALRFIPVDRLEAEGYGQYLSLFDAEAPKAARPR